MKKVYDWCFLFEDGTKEYLKLEFGPEHPNNVIYDLDGPDLAPVYELYPNLREILEERPFAFAVVNPPEYVEN